MPDSGVLLTAYKSLHFTEGRGRGVPAINAFALPGSSKHIADHSLGNTLVSSAIADHAMAVSHYFMIDAAVPMEAYDAGAPEQANMIHPVWRGTYETRLRASEWWKLFPNNDGRHYLTWRGRFGALPNAYNFYSTGEQVLRNNDGPVPALLDVSFHEGVLSWAKQELGKGIDFLGGGAPYHGQGGWERNLDWFVAETEWVPGHMRTPGEAALLTNAQIMANPFFKKFDNPSVLDPILGSSITYNYLVRAQLLAEAIPATTFATGANPIPAFGPQQPGSSSRNYNMPSELPNGWPLERINDPDYRLKGWHHSDFKAVSFFYTYKTYEKLTNLGQLNQP